ncbi:hypothetical protein R3P38DRAFT_2688774 [Favolaschia claudopus]|uniref:F-box domain-containing protein n=1 Tax=Favolaschia claudopus TaxID=2862362 RepID=A0AAW0D7Q4_9AGAR
MADSGKNALHLNRASIERVNRDKPARTELPSYSVTELDEHVPHQRKAAAIVADEILLMIFRHALPPSWVVRYGRTLPPFPRTIWSADFETKLALIRVCKHWYRVGLEFLYESVTLHWIGQLPAFVEALEARDNVGSFVRRLEIGYWIPRGYHTLHDTEIQNILRLCPRIIHFAFNPRIIPPSESFFQTSLPSFPSIPLRLEEGSCRITYLEVCDRIEYQSIVPALLHLAPMLQSLSIALPTQYGDHDLIIFPRLHSLRLCISQESVQPGNYWAIPGLQQLLLHNPTPQFEPPVPTFGGAAAFLTHYGQSLRVLSLASSDDPGILDEILRRCPKLQHLVLVEGLYPSIHDFHHEEVQFLELIGTSRPAASLDQWRIAFPGLRSRRYLSAFHLYYPSLPGIDGDEAALDHSLSASSYLEFLLPRTDDSDDTDTNTSDSDYELNPDDSDSGEPTSSDSDSDEAEDYDDLSHPESRTTNNKEDWEMEREEAISIFRRLVRAGAEVEA